MTERYTKMRSVLAEDDPNLRSLRDIFGAVSDETDSLHAGVWKWGITGKLWQTLDSILEGVNGGCKVLLKYIRWKKK